MGADKCLGWVRVKFIGWKRKFTNNVFLMIEFAVAWEAQVLPLNCPFYRFFVVKQFYTE